MTRTQRKAKKATVRAARQRANARKKVSVKTDKQGAKEFKDLLSGKMARFANDLIKHHRDGGGQQSFAVNIAKESKQNIEVLRKILYENRLSLEIQGMDGLITSQMPMVQLGNEKSMNAALLAPFTRIIFPIVKSAFITAPAATHFVVNTTHKDGKYFGMELGEVKEICRNMSADELEMVAIETARQLA